MSIKIKKEDFVGVWENINHPPFSYDDNQEITFYLGENNTSNINFKINNDEDKSYFSDGFDVCKKENDKFQIIFPNSDLNEGSDLILECRAYFKGVRPGMICKILNIERYFEKI